MLNILVSLFQLVTDVYNFFTLQIQEFRTGATKQSMEVSHAKEETKKYIKQLQDTRARLADLEARVSISINIASNDFQNSCIHAMTIFLSERRSTVLHKWCIILSLE